MKTVKKINKIEFFQHDANNEKLIHLVSQRPALYDYKMPVKFRSKNFKSDLWQEVAYSLGVSVDDCKNRWKNLRDTYQLYRHKCLDRSLTKWRFSENLSFLEDIHTYRSSASRRTMLRKPKVKQKVIISVPGIKDSLQEIDIKNAAESNTKEVQNVNYMIEDFDTSDSKYQENSNYYRKIEINTVNLTEDSFGETEILECDDNNETEDGGPTSTNPFPMDDTIPTESSEQEKRQANLNNQDSPATEQLTLASMDELDFFMEFLKKKIRKLKPEQVNDVQMKYIQIIFDKEEEIRNQAG